MNTHTKISPKNVPTFPAAELSLILKFMDQYNIPRSHGLLGTIWNAKSAEQETSPIGLDQLDIIYRNIYRLSPRPDIGLHFGNSLNLSRWGVLAQALFYSDTLADALREADRMLPLIHSRFVTQHKVTQSFLTTYFSKDPRYTIPGSTQFIHEVAFSTLAKQISGLLAQPFKFESIQLPYPKPEYYASYLEICAKSVEFDCDIGAVTLPLSTLHRPLTLANRAAHSLAVELCEIELARAEEIFSRNIVLLTKRELSSTPNFSLTQDEVASRLSQHPRTFRRKLNEAGTSYRKIVKEIRMEIALRELSEKIVPIAEIAKKCNFSSTAVFRDTFKRWTGFSPTEYQKQFP